MEAHESKIYAVRGEPGRQGAASAGGNGEVYVWNLETNEQVGPVRRARRGVGGQRQSPSARTASGSSPPRPTGDIRIWTRSGKEVGVSRAARRHPGMPWPGRQAWPWCRRAPGHACLGYDLGRRRRLFRLRGTPARPRDRVHADGSQIATGSATAPCGCGRGTGKRPAHVRGHSGYFRGVAFTPMEDRGDGRLRPRERVWDLVARQADGGVRGATTGRRVGRRVGRRKTIFSGSADRTSSGGAPPAEKDDASRNSPLQPQTIRLYLCEESRPAAPSLSRRSFRHAAEPVRESTEAELRVLQSLWDLGRHHPAADDHVYPGGASRLMRRSAVLLDRLERPVRGRDRSAMTTCSWAAVSRDQLIGDQLRPWRSGCAAGRSPRCSPTC